MNAIIYNLISWFTLDYYRIKCCYKRKEQRLCYSIIFKYEHQFDWIVHSIYICIGHISVSLYPLSYHVFVWNFIFLIMDIRKPQPVISYNMLLSISNDPKKTQIRSHFLHLWGCTFRKYLQIFAGKTVIKKIT